MTILKNSIVVNLQSTHRPPDLNARHHPLRQPHQHQQHHQQHRKVRRRMHLDQTGTQAPLWLWHPAPN
jgi:hypothetical protein